MPVCTVPAHSGGVGRAGGCTEVFGAEVGHLLDMAARCQLMPQDLYGCLDLRLLVLMMLECCTQRVEVEAGDLDRRFDRAAVIGLARLASTLASRWSHVCELRRWFLSGSSVVVLVVGVGLVGWGWTCWRVSVNVVGVG